MSKKFVYKSVNKKGQDKEKERSEEEVDCSNGTQRNPSYGELNPHYTSPFTPLRHFFTQKQSLQNYISPQSASTWLFKSDYKQQNKFAGNSGTKEPKVIVSRGTLCRINRDVPSMCDYSSTSSGSDVSYHILNNETFSRSRSRHSFSSSRQPLLSSSPKKSESSFASARSSSTRSSFHSLHGLQFGPKVSLSKTCPPSRLMELMKRDERYDLSSTLSSLDLSENEVKNEGQVTIPPTSLFTRSGRYASLPYLSKEKRWSLLYSPKPFYKSNSDLSDEQRLSIASTAEASSSNSKGGLSTANDFKSTTEEFKSTTDEFKPTLNEFKSTASGFKPTASEFKPTTNDQYKSTASGFKPTASEFKPTTNDQFKSTAREFKPIASGFTQNVNNGMQRTCNKMTTDTKIPPENECCCQNKGKSIKKSKPKMLKHHVEKKINVPLTITLKRPEIQSDTDSSLTSISSSEKAADEYVLQAKLYSNVHF